MSVSGRILDSDSKNMISATMLTGDNQSDSRKITAMDVGVVSGNSYTLDITDKSNGAFNTAVLGRFYALQFMNGGTCTIQNSSSYPVCVIWDQVDTDMNGSSGSVNWKFRVLVGDDSFSEVIFNKCTLVMIPFMIPYM